VWLTPTTCNESFTYNPAVPIFRIPKDFKYAIPNADQIGVFKDYVRTFPDIDTPEIFGLHPNADLTFRVKEVNAMFTTLDDTQPKGGGGGGGVSREDVVYEKVGAFPPLRWCAALPCSLLAPLRRLT
jgi:dynein heavy chain, axonemal